MEIFKVFSFDSAHRLPQLPPEHKCSRLHGHTFRVEIHIKGPVQPIGWVRDFDDIGQIFDPLYQQLDHRYLNEIEGLENPSSENIAKWIWQRLKPELPQLSRIVVQETCNNGCIYEGDEE